MNAFREPPNCDLIFFLTNFSQIKLINFSYKESFCFKNFFFPRFSVDCTKIFFIPVALLKVDDIF